MVYSSNGSMVQAVSICSFFVASSGFIYGKGTVQRCNHRRINNPGNLLTDKKVHTLFLYCKICIFVL